MRRLGGLAVGLACAGVAVGGCSAAPSDPVPPVAPPEASPVPSDSSEPAPPTPARSSVEPPSPQPPASGPVTTGFEAVDGDTVERGEVSVRVLGIDTPEVGECGYERATAVTERFLSGGIRLTQRSGKDQYGRVLAYVEDEQGRDLGTVLIRKGLANARYDGTDGYDWHPNQDRYNRIDGRVRHDCGRSADGLGGPEPYRPVPGEPFPSCDAAESAGATPLVRGRSGYNPDLDGDGDGVACED